MITFEKPESENDDRELIDYMYQNRQIVSFETYEQFPQKDQLNYIDSRDPDTLQTINIRLKDQLILSGMEFTYDSGFGRSPFIYAGNY